MNNMTTILLSKEKNKSLPTYKSSDAIRLFPDVPENMSTEDGRIAYPSIGSYLIRIALAVPENMSTEDLKSVMDFVAKNKQSKNSDSKHSKAYQAYLESEKKYFEVYRRLANS